MHHLIISSFFFYFPTLVLHYGIFPIPIIPTVSYLTDQNSTFKACNQVLKYDFFFLSLYYLTKKSSGEDNENKMLLIDP